jgi:hypothetical protein
VPPPSDPSARSSVVPGSDCLAPHASQSHGLSAGNVGGTGGSGRMA